MVAMPSPVPPVGIAPLVDDGLGNSSYLVDLGAGRALVLDPVRDPGPYLALARNCGLDIGYAVETHLHADFVSGGRELAARGARLLAPAAGGLAFGHHGLAHGDEVDLGGLTLRALGTPGHTPEHLSYLLADGARPVALFSGGALLVGAVARTDLIAADRTEELARALWRALHEQVLGLPDDLAVYPTHGAGSFCAAPAGGERVTTIGQEKAANPLLAATDEDAFVAGLLAGLGSYPPYFRRLREVNRLGPPVYGPLPPPLHPVPPAQVRRLVADGAGVVDARPASEFAAGHLPGALSIPLRAQFATWLGWLVPAEQPVVVVLGEGQDRDEVVRQCLKIGYEQLVGELAGGVAAWGAAGFPLARIDVVDPRDVAAPVLDVRQDAEFVAGHVPAALHVELGSLGASDLVPHLPRDRVLTVMCGHGERAMTAASLLAARGHRKLAVALGGVEDWAAATGRAPERGR